MNICIAGKNNIAIEVCRYVIEHYPQATIYALINCNETGVDSWQHSYLKYLQSESKVNLSTLEDMYKIEDLVFISTEYDRLIKPHLFKTKHLFNIHFSLLPSYKGVYMSAWPILNGEEYSGVTLHEIESGIDTGNIIAQKRFKLSSNETSYSLYLKFIKYGTSLVIKNLDRLINNTYMACPQSSSGSTYYSKKSIDYSNLTVDLNATATQIDRQIRAFYFPFYQVANIYGVSVERTKITTEKSRQKPGTILYENDRKLVMTSVDYNIILYKQMKEKDHNAVCEHSNLTGGRNSLRKFTPIAYRRALAA